MPKIYHTTGCPGGNCGDYHCKCECGYAPDSFACKIRHIHMNSGDAKAGNVNGRRQTVEITENGRIIR